MAIVQSPSGEAYPLASTIMNLARVRVNDTMNDLGGDLLANDTPYAGVMLNSAWHWLQAKWRESGGEPFKKEMVVYGFPARTSEDIVNQAYLGMNDSSNGVLRYESPILPQDLITPLSIWRRPSTEVSSQSLQLMVQAVDGLPRYLDCNVYDWRQSNGMYFYGEQYAQDFLIRYIAAWPDLDITNPLSRATIVRCENCLAARVAYEYSNRTSSPGAAVMQQLAEDEFQNILQRTSRRQQRQSLRRQPYGSAGATMYQPVIARNF